MTQVKGFSMIELMIVVVVLSVMASMFYPAFQQYVVRSRRAEAQAMLQRLMAQQERYYTQHNSYVAFSARASDPEAALFTWWSGRSAPVSAYELEGKACEGELIADCVQLIATPGTSAVDAQFKDPACGTLILKSTGQHLATGPAARCWQ